jgi:hypothetical protein
MGFELTTLVVDGSLPFFNILNAPIALRINSCNEKNIYDVSSVQVYILILIELDILLHEGHGVVIVWLLGTYLLCIAMSTMFM